MYENYLGYEPAASPFAVQPAASPFAVQPAAAKPSLASLLKLTDTQANQYAAPIAERNAIVSQLEGLGFDPTPYISDGNDFNNLDLSGWQNILDTQQTIKKNADYAARGAAYNKTQGAIPNNLYTFANVKDYYDTYGTVPISWTGMSGYYDPGVKETSTGYLTPDAAATYTLYSPRSGKTIGSGVGAEGLLSLAQQANDLNANQGRKADWQLYQTPAEGGSSNLLGGNLYNSDLTLLGKIVATGLPIAAAFIPGLGPIASAALSAAAAGVGAAMQDQDPLKAALIAGGTAGLLKGTPIGQGISKAVSSVPVIGSAINSVGNGISNAIGSAIPQAASNAASDIVVKGAVNAGTKSLVNAGTNALVNAAVNSGVNAAPSTLAAKPAPATEAPVAGDQTIVVKGANKAAADAAQAAVSSLAVNPAPAPADQTIQVTAKKPTPGTTDALTALGVTVPGAINTSSVAPADNATTTPADKSALTTKDKIQLGLTAAGLLSGAIGGATSGGGGNATIPGGIGGMNSTFSAKLPTANLPGLGDGTGVAGTAGAGPRTASDLAVQGLTRNPQDWYRYGYGPQQSFFNEVPQGAPNTSKAFTGYAGGGDVAGPGTGRSDSIPARLSDGEYVMDAETVALLGDGSTKAGAKKLDTFRVNLRKQKGRNLAQGKFSVKAKAPEHYLAGGRS